MNNNLNKYIIRNFSNRLNTNNWLIGKLNPDTNEFTSSLFLKNSVGEKIEEIKVKVRIWNDEKYFDEKKFLKAQIYKGAERYLNTNNGEVPELLYSTKKATNEGEGSKWQFYIANLYEKDGVLQIIKTDESFEEIREKHEIFYTSPISAPLILLHCPDESEEDNVYYGPFHYKVSQNGNVKLQPMMADDDYNDYHESDAVGKYEINNKNIYVIPDEYFGDQCFVSE
ncbi:MAG: hypothetical protein IKR92_06120, partial [Alphaproteobacteria bacterium]|nr:hypothetical protein [Alphaproteobacteria bacterium]